jgi:MFS-type transporter involved in bile tolerance (Atg22 family)
MTITKILLVVTHLCAYLFVFWLFLKWLYTAVQAFSKKHGNYSTIIVLSIAAFCLLMAGLCIGNILYNWHYFKQYDGIKNAEYYWAYKVWYATSIGFILSLSATIIALLYYKNRN